MFFAKREQSANALSGASDDWMPVLRMRWNDCCITLEQSRIGHALHTFDDVVDRPRYK